MKPTWVSEGHRVALRHRLGIADHAARQRHHRVLDAVVGKGVANAADSAFLVQVEVDSQLLGVGAGLTRGRCFGQLAFEGIGREAAGHDAEARGRRAEGNRIGIGCRAGIAATAQGGDVSAGTARAQRDFYVDEDRTEKAGGREIEDSRPGPGRARARFFGEEFAADRFGADPGAMGGKACCFSMFIRFDALHRYPHRELIGNRHRAGAIYGAHVLWHQRELTFAAGRQVGVPPQGLDGVDGFGRGGRC
jgi:hypothetical protein